MNRESLKTDEKALNNQSPASHHGGEACTLKLMDAIDAPASSLARAYEQMSAQPFWVPELPLAAWRRRPPRRECRRRHDAGL